jgi:hypothetical protein
VGRRSQPPLRAHGRSSSSGSWPRRCRERAATFDDVGNVAAFAASDQPRTITGSTINIACGMTVDSEDRRAGPFSFRGRSERDPIGIRDAARSSNSKASVPTIDALASVAIRCFHPGDLGRSRATSLRRKAFTLAGRRAPPARVRHGHGGSKQLLGLVRRHAASSQLLECDVSGGQPMDESRAMGKLAKAAPTGTASDLRDRGLESGSRRLGPRTRLLARTVCNHVDRGQPGSSARRLPAFGLTRLSRPRRARRQPRRDRRASQGGRRRTRPPSRPP